jgi:hypothetical protein
MPIGPHPSCLCCRSERVAELNEACWNHDSLESMSKQFGLSESSLQRHRAKHLSPRRPGPESADSSFPTTGSALDRLENLLARNVSALERATKSGSLATSSSLLRECRETISAIGRLRGETASEDNSELYRQCIMDFLACLPKATLLDFSEGRINFRTLATERASELRDAVAKTLVRVLERSE